MGFSLQPGISTLLSQSDELKDMTKNILFQID